MSSRIFFSIRVIIGCFQANRVVTCHRRRFHCRYCMNIQFQYGAGQSGVVGFESGGWMDEWPVGAKFDQPNSIQ